MEGFVVEVGDEVHHKADISHFTNEATDLPNPISTEVPQSISNKSTFIRNESLSSLIPDEHFPLIANHESSQPVIIRLPYSTTDALSPHSSTDALSAGPVMPQTTMLMSPTVANPDCSMLELVRLHTGELPRPMVELSRPTTDSPPSSSKHSDRLFNFVPQPPPSPASVNTLLDEKTSSNSPSRRTHPAKMRDDGYEGVSYETRTDPFWKDRVLQIGIIDNWKVCCCYGLASVMSGQFVGFNAGYYSGSMGFFLSFLLAASGYMCLAFCMSELASSMPFCGGSYGYARQSIGKHAGLFVGCIECIEYIFLLTTNLYFLGQLFSLITGTDPKYEPVWWLFIYIVNLSIQLIGGRTMFRLAAFLAVFNIGFLILYVLGTLKWANLDYYGRLPTNMAAPPTTSTSTFSTTNAWSYGGTSFGGWITDKASAFFTAFPFAMWPFIGVEIIPTTSEEIREPRKNIPKAIISATIILALCTLPILLLVPSLPSITAAVSGQNSVANNLLDIGAQTFPLNGGFSLLFTDGDAVSLTATQVNLLVIISMFPIWNNGYGTGIGAARQMFAMSRSGYFPKILSLTSKRGSPYVAHTLITLVCYATSLIVFMSNNPAKNFSLIFNVTSICGVVNYLLQFMCFCIYRYRFRGAPDDFKSPLGISGAVIGFIIFGVAFVSMCVYTENMSHAFYALLAILAIPIAYFFLYSRKHLTISPEESHAFFHIMTQKQNQKRAERVFRPVDKKP